MPHSKGFTLVEMLVVLALTGLLLSVVSPSFVKAQAARVQSANLKLVENKLSMLAVQAVIAKTPIEIAPFLSDGLPSDWQVIVKPSGASFDSLGLCNARSITIQKSKVALRRWEFSSGFCALALDLQK